ncbi:GNAT family N-acetyltransferase [Paenibacillus marinisediminis]
MNNLNVTKEYYSKWLDVDLSILDKKGIHLQCSEERDRQQIGYPRKFELYCLVREGTTILSYSKEIENEVRILCEVLNTGKLPICLDAIKGIFGAKVKHNIKYFFNELPNVQDTLHTKQLQEDDYIDYLRFFMSQNPKSNPEGWLLDYYKSLVCKGFCWGVWIDGILVSVTDAPEVPFMENQIVEIGINTLKPYRNKGFGSITARAFIRYLNEINKTPLWSCAIDNSASQRLANNIGFRKFADVYTVSMTD